MTCPYLDGFEFGYQPTPTDIVEGHLHRRCACRQVVPNSDGSDPRTTTTERFSSAETAAAARTVATAEMCFCLAPGMTTSLVSEV